MECTIQSRALAGAWCLLLFVGGCTTHVLDWNDSGALARDVRSSSRSDGGSSDSTSRDSIPDSGVVTLADAPPPISGGTLTVLRNGTTAVAADPDRDLVYIVDLYVPALTATIALQHGDEPGRVVEGADGRVHVALRRGGAVATIDVGSATIVDRTSVCSAPRGLAYDASGPFIVVACAGGELVTLPESGGAPVRSVRLDDDLRDVLIVNGQWFVTRFRTAELLSLSSNGTVTSRLRPAITTTEVFSGTDAGVSDGGVAPVNVIPDVAWRTIASDGNRT
jgi:hypothetical protein